ncbi:MAG: coniferyl aldehyde dehydrogenase [Pseudomonadota bacterium]
MPGPGQKNQKPVETADGSDDTLDIVFQAQKRAFLNNPMPGVKERIQTLNRLKQAILANRDDIVAALNSDYSCRSEDETLLGEVLPSVEGIAFAARHVKSWMKPVRRRPGLMFQPATARVLYQPLGVVGIITPWNYPLFLSMGPLAGVLAAGNRAMIRMSRNTPATAGVVSAMIARTFDPDQVWVAGHGPGSEFAAKPWDHLVFTGSTTVGRHVMRAGADNLTPLTLELGGKSPAIIGPDAPMDPAARSIAFGKLFNAGQTCVAPDYVLCPKGRVDDFMIRFEAHVRRMYPTMADNPQYTAIIDESQLGRLRDLIQDARDRGGRVIVINPGRESFENTRKLPVHLVVNVNPEMTALNREIFGPVLPVIPYESLAQAMAWVNGRPRPLALYYFDTNRRNADTVIAGTRSGGVVINDTLIHAVQDDLPFGGIGESGMGQYHAREGFLAFSKARPVVTKSRFNTGPLVHPPYGRRIHDWLYRLFLG